MNTLETALVSATSLPRAYWMLVAGILLLVFGGFARCAHLTGARKRDALLVGFITCSSAIVIVLFGLLVGLTESGDIPW